jgi:hypothetical protein
MAIDANALLVTPVGGNASIIRALFVKPVLAPFPSAVTDAEPGADTEAADIETELPLPVAEASIVEPAVVAPAQVTGEDSTPSTPNAATVRPPLAVVPVTGPADLPARNYRKQW